MGYRLDSTKFITNGVCDDSNNSNSGIGISGMHVAEACLHLCRKNGFNRILKYYMRVVLNRF